MNVSGKVNKTERDEKEKWKGFCERKSEGNVVWGRIEKNEENVKDEKGGDKA